MEIMLEMLETETNFRISESPLFSDSLNSDDFGGGVGRAAA